MRRNADAVNTWRTGGRRALSGLLVALLLTALVGISCRSSVKPDPQDRITIALEAMPLILKADSASVSTVWATVLESGRPAADSTAVVFAATLGEITPEAWTEDGLARAAFTPGSQAGVATVVAQVRAVRDTVLITIF